MAETDRKLLEAFLKKNHCFEAGRIMNVLEKFYQKAETGFYGFEERKRKDFEWTKIKTAIEKISGEEVKEINFVSAHKPIVKMGWMTEKVYDELVGNTFKMLKKSLRKNLGVSIGSDERNNLRYDLGEKKWNNLNAILAESLLYCLYETFEKLLWRNLWINHWSNIFFYLAYQLKKDFAKCKDMELLLEVMDKHIVLGKKQDEDNVWLVLKN